MGGRKSLPQNSERNLLCSISTRIVTIARSVGLLGRVLDGLFGPIPGADGASGTMALWELDPTANTRCDACKLGCSHCVHPSPRAALASIRAHGPASPGPVLVLDHADKSRASARHSDLFATAGDFRARR